MYEPLYTAAEMRTVEERYPGYPGTVPEVNVVEQALFFQRVDAAVDGRGDDVAADPFVDPLQESGCGEMVEM